MLSADNTDDGGRSFGLKARLCLHVPASQAMSHHAVDITMIDLLRVGGVTQWMKVAGMAEAKCRMNQNVVRRVGSTPS